MNPKICDVDPKIITLYSIFYNSPEAMIASSREAKYFAFILGRPNDEIRTLRETYYSINKLGNTFYLEDGKKLRLPTSFNSLCRSWHSVINKINQVGV